MIHTLIAYLMKLYIIVIIVDFVLSYIPSMKNNGVAQLIRGISEPSLKPVRKFLPKDLGFDASPLVVVILLLIVLRLW